MTHKLIGLILLACCLTPITSCDGPDRPTTPEISAGIFVDSDPRGADIYVDGQSTGKTTPDTIFEAELRQQRVALMLDSAGVTYGVSTTVETHRDVMVEVYLPMLVGCASISCVLHLVRYHEASGIKFAQSALGVLLHIDGAGDGLIWPADSENSYVSTGSAVFAGVVSGPGDTVALGPYDWHYLAGRPAPLVSWDQHFRLQQEAWVAPPSDATYLTTVRGLAIKQDLVASPDLEDVLVLRIVFRNISNDPLYRKVDPLVPSGGITYEDAWIGFALDGDVGLADSDLLSYEPDLDLVYIYESDFHAPGFSVDWQQRPGLIGLRALETPQGTNVRLNGWVRELEPGKSGDWFAGTPNEASGWYYLSGQHTSLPNHEHPRVGFVPEEPVDVRASVSAGPVTLAPGDSAALTVAVMLAAPKPGSFSSGTVVPPGDPLDPDRAIADVAQELMEKAEAAKTLLHLVRP